MKDQKFYIILGAAGLLGFALFSRMQKRKQQQAFIVNYALQNYDQNTALYWGNLAREMTDTELKIFVAFLQTQPLPAASPLALQWQELNKKYQII